MFFGKLQDSAQGMWTEVNRERYASKAKARTAYRLITRSDAKKRGNR